MLTLKIFVTKESRYSVESVAHLRLEYPTYATLAKELRSICKNAQEKHWDDCTFEAVVERNGKSYRVPLLAIANSKLSGKSLKEIESITQSDFNYNIAHKFHSVTKL